MDILRWFNVEWRSFGKTFTTRLIRRLLLGCFIGTLAGLAIHFITVDDVFWPTVRSEWDKSLFYQDFFGVEAYRREFWTLITILLVGIAFLISIRIPRFLRAWWAGIVSLVTLVTVLLSVTLLEFPRAITGLAFSFILLALIVLEYWRQRMPSPRVPTAREKTFDVSTRRAQVKSLDPDKWRALPSDDPIHDWNEDLIGRTAVVELLEEHVFVLRTPVLALHGSLGDGKSSVLNLLRRNLEQQAVVVSFNAWLPGSETTFAIDLFRDIATECRKRFYVPQLRKRTLLYAKTITGSVPHLAGLREILPSESQTDEINELRSVLSRIPSPIVVLLDEMDRMQKEELLVVLKVLRGIASIPNISFICAFSETELRNRLKGEGALSYDYLEKFFPVTVSLGAPDPEVLGYLFQSKLKALFERQQFFRVQEDKNSFAELLSQGWEASLSRLCTNFRKASLLLNDITSAARPISGEVNAFDLVAIESLRRFYPDLHGTLRKNQIFLTYDSSSWGKRSPYMFSDEEKKKASVQFFQSLEKKISESEAPEAARVLLSLLFPAYQASKTQGLSIYALTRPTSEESAEREKRICDPDYFQIYFRAAVPEEMFSNAELNAVIAEFNSVRSPSEVSQIFRRVLSGIPKQHPKRSDFLWKIGRSVGRLKEEVAEELAYAAATNADEYAYDVLNVGEAARALNIVFEVAQKFSPTTKVQQVLMGSMVRAADDTFARRLWEYTRDKDRNKVLTNFSLVNVEEVKNALIQRMRNRYASGANVSISQGDWWAFRLWGENSGEDREMAYGFWRQYVDHSQKRIAQAFNFVFPPNTTWDKDPTPILDSFFPVKEMGNLFETSTMDGNLDESEAKAVERFRELLKGKWFDITKRNI